MSNKGCGCSDDSNSQSSLETKTNSQIANLSLPGHPIIMIDEPSDVALFDLTTGKGSDIWEGWALMDGKTHPDITNGNAPIFCRNMMDRVPVGALSAYNVGDQFGEATHQLITTELPVHNHVLTDAGHTHAVNDPGHNHTVNDPGHTHTVNDSGHTHAVTNTMALSKNVATASEVDSTVVVDSGSSSDVPDTWTEQSISLVGGVSVNNNTTGISNANSNAGITNVSNTTGISNASANTGISIASAGADEPHNNLQPSSAVVFVKRIYVVQ